MGLIRWIRGGLGRPEPVQAASLQLPPPTPPVLRPTGRSIYLEPPRRVPLRRRCLELTAFFETDLPPPACYGRVSGNFDGQGLSVGCLQWNLGQGTLQPLLRALLATAAVEVREAIGAAQVGLLQAMLALKSRADQIAWARGLQDEDRVAPIWRQAFQRLGALEVFQDLQTEAAAPRFQWALDQAVQWGSPSERAVALFFDIRVQNGSIPRAVVHQIQKCLAAPPDPLPEPDPEVWKLATIAQLRAEAADPRWVEDVRQRKLAIARGAGRVHGTWVVLEAGWDLTMRAVPEVALRLARIGGRVLA